jgi:hypothetical protein
MPSDREIFEQVLRGIRGDNPEHAKATAAEKAQAKKIIDAQKKALRKKFNSRQNGGGDVIDTGMFNS